MIYIQVPKVELKQRESVTKRILALSGIWNPYAFYALGDTNPDAQDLVRKWRRF
jgi:hypothetical protein